jgi:phage terminase large subunit-like protein
VFITGLGKKPHPRRLYATTNGDVRDGPLDDLLRQAEQILNSDIGDNGLLPLSAAWIAMKKTMTDPSGSSKTRHSRIFPT